MSAPDLNRIYGSSRTGLEPDLNSYDEFPSRQRAVAELWAYSRFYTGNPLERRWLWMGGDTFLPDDELSGLPIPAHFVAQVNELVAEMESEYADAAYEQDRMFSECRP